MDTEGTADLARRYNPAAHLRDFERLFGRRPRLYRAPGRVNLIGEHTDYNDGWVMPAAMDLAAWVAIAPRPDRRVCLVSDHYPDQANFDLDDITPRHTPRALPPWSHALRGVALLLERAGHHLCGADILLRSQIPIGAGLSSSAAVEVACGFALASESDVHLDPTALARLCQQASHEFGGTRCGIMDSFIACHGRAGHVLQLDTRSLASRWWPWPADLSLVVCNTMVRHDNATSQYNQRRVECESAVRALRPRLPELTSLRDLGLDQLDRHADLLTPTLLARCRHVVSENARVAAAAAALGARDFAALGELLGASHRSLRDDYQVSCPELDLMAELCGREPGVYGARMMGGGFGGCVLALAEPGVLATLRARVAAAYAQTTGCAPDLWACQPASGVSAVPLGGRREES